MATLSDSASRSAAWFPPTLWSIVLAASHSSAPGSREALETLCRAYWRPVYAYLRRCGQSPHDAEDLTQGFLAHLCQNDRLGTVDREKGCFRSFLLVSLKHFLLDAQAKARALKRGGGQALVSLDAATAEERCAIEPPDKHDPEKEFERRWALTVLDRTIEQLEAEYLEAGKHDRFALMRPFLLSEDAGQSYAEVGRTLGISEGAVKMAMLRLRRRGRELFRAEVAKTVAGEDEIEDEIRGLIAALAD